MKRLFCVGSAFFDNKADAKKARDCGQLTMGTAYPVTLGPDHWRYGVKGNPRTHSHKRQAKKLYK